MDPDLIDNVAMHRFELPLDKEGVIAAAYYRVDGDKVVLTHTEVPPEYGGRGIGSRLARGVFEAIRASGRKIVPQCPFIGTFAARHPEYADLITA